MTLDEMGGKFVLVTLTPEDIDGCPIEIRGAPHLERIMSPDSAPRPIHRLWVLRPVPSVTENEFGPVSP